MLGPCAEEQGQGSMWLWEFSMEADIWQDIHLLLQPLAITQDTWVAAMPFSPLLLSGLLQVHSLFILHL